MPTRKPSRPSPKKFLEEDPNSPSGYSLKTGHTAQQAVNAYNKIEDGVVGACKKVENAFVDAFLEKTDDDPSDPKAD